MADAQVALRHVALDDKYDLTKDRVFITGTQAIVRLLLMQRERDRLAGLNTAGLRLRLSRLADWRARPEPLAREEMAGGADIVFQPGLNEELAATAVLGHAAGRDARRRASTTACSASGTARGRASTARATCSATPTWPVPRAMAACWR